MSEEKFDIVFRGDIVLGSNLVQVKANLAKLFKLPAPKVEALFTGKSVVLKKQLDKETAKKYQVVLTKAGAQVSVVTNQTNIPAKPKTRKLTLAPVGANLMPRGASAKEGQAEAEEIDISGFSLKEAAGNLVDQTELAHEQAVEVALPSWNLAETGSDLGQAKRSEPEKIVQPPTLDIAEAGADLGQKPSNVAPVKVGDINFDVAPVGSDMGEKKSHKTPLNPKIDHLSLS